MILCQLRLTLEDKTRSASSPSRSKGTFTGLATSQAQRALTEHHRLMTKNQQHPDRANMDATTPDATSPATVGGASTTDDVQLTLEDIAKDAFRRKFFVDAFGDEREALELSFAFLVYLRKYKQLAGRKELLQNIAEEVLAKYLNDPSDHMRVHLNTPEVTALLQRITMAVQEGYSTLDLFSGMEEHVSTRLADEKFPQFLASDQYQQLCNATRERRDLALGEVLVDRRRTRFLELYVQKTDPRALGNLLFWMEVQTTFLPLIQTNLFSVALFEEIQLTVRKIFNLYLADNSSLTARLISDSVRKDTLKKILQLQGEPFSPPRYANIFRPAQDKVWQWLQSFIYPRFKQSALYVLLVVEIENIESDIQLRRLSEHVQSDRTSSREGVVKASTLIIPVVYGNATPAIGTEAATFQARDHAEKDEFGSAVCQKGTSQEQVVELLETAWQPPMHFRSVALKPQFRNFYLQPSLPPIDFPFHVALQELTSQTVVNLLASLVLEQSLILVSQRRSALMAVGMTLRELLRPFEWQHLFLPLCPLTVAQQLARDDFFAPRGHAAYPYLIGVEGCLVHQRTKESGTNGEQRHRIRNSLYNIQKANLQLLTGPSSATSQPYPPAMLQTNAVILDIDADDIYVPERMEVHELPQSLVRILQTLVKSSLGGPALANADSVLFSRNPVTTVPQFEKMVDAAVIPTLSTDERLRLSFLWFFEMLFGDTVYHFCSFRKRFAQSDFLGRPAGEKYLIFEADSFLDAKIELGCREFFRQCFQTELFRRFLIRQHQHFSLPVKDPTSNAGSRTTSGDISG
ncbi:TPA: hypothetical protein N0F65_003920 [Lagenidium giganteum]|uniref:RGS domain-containing protein n=1 Tax=Lagenidium giganteum TaxID=4803 RepID=A0AAV2ZFF4_9STRA|nr:TPA: hypothetical protein N0F65_003920 [Lagenidium giganteum]